MSKIECKKCKIDLYRKGMCATPIGVYCCQCWNQINRKLTPLQRQELLEEAQKAKFMRDLRNIYLNNTR